MMIPYGLKRAPHIRSDPWETSKDVYDKAKSKERQESKRELKEDVERLRQEVLPL